MSNPKVITVGDRCSYPRSAWGTADLAAERRLKDASKRLESLASLTGSAPVSFAGGLYAESRSDQRRRRADELLAAAGLSRYGRPRRK